MKKIAGLIALMLCWQLGVGQLTSNSPQATGPNQARHFALSVDSEGDENHWLHQDIVWQSGPPDYEIYYTYDVGGGGDPDWEPRILIGDGEYSCITTCWEAPNFKSVAVFSSNGLRPYVHIRDEDDEWRRFDWFPEGMEPWTIRGAPSGLWGSAAVGNSRSLAAVYAMRYLDDPPGFYRIRFVCGWYDVMEHSVEITEVYDVTPEAQEDARDPCIAITPAGPYDYYHITWEGGSGLRRVFCCQRDPDGNWSGPARLLATHAVIESTQPFVETYGDSVYVVWRRTPSEIRYARRWIEEPVENMQLEDGRHQGEIRTAPWGAEVMWPVSSDIHATMWSERDSPAGEFDVWLDIRWDDIHEVYPRIVNTAYNSRCANLEIYTVVYGGEPPGEIMTVGIWTEETSTPSLYYILHGYSMGEGEGLMSTLRHTRNLPAFYEVTTGNPIPSPYCKKREWITSDCDYGDTLLYELPYLYPNKFYYFKAVLSYFPEGRKDPPIESSITVNLEDSFDTTFTCSLIHPETLDVFLPRNIYKRYKGNP